MKRFWLVLLSLGLVMAFSVSAFAVDVKVSAEYYAAGLYLNKVTVDNGFENWAGERGSVQPSTAFFYQRLRVGTDFVVSPCLKLVTRFNAMERIWGGMRSEPFYSDPGQRITDNPYSAASMAENENIGVDTVYIDYTSPIGLFKVGYMPDYVFGTDFANRANGVNSGQIQYFIQKGAFIGFLGYAKEAEKNYSYLDTNMAGTDADYDSYRIAGIYNFKGGEAGALLLWERDARWKGGFPGWPDNYLSNVFVLDPYVKAKIGPVALQAELLYYFGDARKYEDNSTNTNMSISALSAFVDATADLGMFYVGGSIAYLSGDDETRDDTISGSNLHVGQVNTAGLDWNPCLIMFNTETLAYWVGPVYGHSDTVVDNEMSNAWFFQGRVGVKPTSQLDVMMSLSYATADKKPVGVPDGGYGTEIDVTGTYKITNNLSYMLGAGYLFTGDYFKGYNSFPWGGSKTSDDFILINKLTLNF